jgi:hypothetical protein
MRITIKDIRGIIFPDGGAADSQKSKSSGKMNDDAIFDRLITYLIDSSTAMDAVAKSLSLDPNRISQINRLNVQIDNAKCLMSLVFHPYDLTIQISSPLYVTGKSMDLLIGGSLEERMSVRGSCYHRFNGDPPSFGDIPPEVVRKTFVHLSPSDLAAVRLVCRGWNPTGQDVMMSRSRVGDKRGGKFICGLHLRRLVGFKTFAVKSLDLDVRDSGYICAVNIAVNAALTLTSLKLDFHSADVVCYYVLQNILKYCRGTRHLQLNGFDVGDDAAGQDEEILRNIKDGFGRLNRLDLIRCRGNILSLVHLTDIPNLSSFYYDSSGETAQDSEGIIVAVATKYPTLVSIRLEAEFDSSASLLKVMAGCPDLETLFFHKNGGALVLSRSDILSLRRLKSLDIDCEVEDDAVSALASCKSLKNLRVVYYDLSEVLQVIGGNLASLEIGVASEQVLVAILKSCVNLQYLKIGGFLAGKVSVGAIKKGLVRLAKLKVNGASVRLGTDWVGSDE